MPSVCGYLEKCSPSVAVDIFHSTTQNSAKEASPSVKCRELSEALPSVGLPLSECQCVDRREVRTTVIVTKASSSVMVGGTWWIFFAKCRLNHSANTFWKTKKIIAAVMLGRPCRRWCPATVGCATPLCPRRPAHEASPLSPGPVICTASPRHRPCRAGVVAPAGRPSCKPVPPARQSLVFYLFSNFVTFFYLLFQKTF
jgi:hypothetical protein